MNQMKKYLTLLLLIAVVFVSGCNISGGGGPGVAITYFSFSSSEVEPATTVSLELTLENQGEKTARGVRAELLGLTDQWGISGGRPRSIGDLAPSIRGERGEEKTEMWLLSAPSKDVKITYDASIVVTYSYETTMEAQFKAVTNSYYQRTGETGGLARASTSTSGPLSISAKTTAKTISGGRFPITISVSNNGGGRVFTGSYQNPDALDKLHISISGATCSRSEVNLRDGKSATLYCYINAGAVRDYQNFPISVHASYGYLLERKSSVTVLPRVPV